MKNDNQDLSEIEKLEKFALNTSRQIKISKTPYSHKSMHPVTYHKRTVCLSENSDNDLFFICFGDSRNFGNYANYSGVFFHIDTPADTQITIRPKDILDKINPFLKCSSYKTKDNKFDTNVIIEENDTDTISSLLQSNNVRKNIIDIFKSEQIYRIGINEINLDFVEHFKNKSFIGIYILNDWILEATKIEYLFKICKQIKETITNEKDI